MGSGYNDADARLGPSRLWGLDVTAELHRVGINLRHMGLLRRKFWRRLTGTARCDFGSSVLRTSSDFRLELERGSRILVAGQSVSCLPRRSSVKTGVPSRRTV